MTQPVVFMIAGPNGAGKTTAAFNLLPEFLLLHEFVNADEIARGLSPLNAEGQSIEAGRLMLRRVDGLIEAAKSFAFETTGSSRVFVNRMERAKKAGYRFGLIYLWLPLVELAKNRVKTRVAQGGHNVPDEIIARRYIRGLANVWRYYLPLADQASLFENVLPSAYLEPIAEKYGEKLRIYRPEIWKAIERAAIKEPHDATA